MFYKVMRIMLAASVFCAGPWAIDASAAPLDDLDSVPSIGQDDLSLFGNDELTPSEPANQPEDSVKTQPTKGTTVIQAARAAFMQKEFAKSLNLLTIAKAQDPTLPPPRLVLADMYFQVRANELGRATLERVALEDPTHPELWRLLGSVALTDQRWTEAILHFERGLELPAPSVWNPQQRQKFIFSCKKGLAAAMERRGDAKAAAHVLGEMAEMTPADSQLRDRYASVLFQADMKDKAYEQYKIAYLRDGEMSPPELSMGIMYVNSGDYSRGDQWFARAINAHPSSPTLHFQIAVALMVQDRAVESAKHSAQAAQLGLASPDLEMVRGYASRQLRQYEIAERFFRSALEQNPDDAAAMNQLALVLIEQGDDEKQKEAMELATKMFQALENSANAQATLGWVMYRSGQVNEAETILREAVQKPSIGPEALYLAGRAFSDQGKNSDAANVAEMLASRISLPGIYVLRPLARKWLETQADAAPAEAIP